MKKILLSFFAMLAFSNTAFADDQLKVENVYLSTTADNTDFVVFLDQDAKSSVSGVNFSIQLPDGVEFVKDNSGEPQYKMGTTFDSSPTLNIVDGILKVAMGSSNPIKGTKGTLIAFKIKRSSSFNAANGDVLTGGKIFSAFESKKGVVGDDVPLSDFNFDIKVTDRVVLDENSPFEPDAIGEVNVLVKRTIKKNTWSTIYLPLDMDYTAVLSAFGSDVKIASFTGWSIDIDGTTVNSINVEFTTVAENAMEAGKPYLICLSNDVSEFMVDGVDVYDPENNPETVQIKVNGKNSKGTMKGNFGLHAMNQYDMFLQNNSFYYALAGQNIKGFRAIFTFKDNLNKSYLISENSETRALFSIDGASGTTGINSNSFVVAKTGKVYSMTGIYMGEMEDMNSLPKGVYIVDGKKVVKK